MQKRITFPQFLNASEMGDLLGVRAANVRRWARLGQIPKLVLPGGRFVFDPEAVIATLRKLEGADND